MYTIDQIKNAIKAKGYTWFEGDKDFDLNIVGIRNTAVGNAVTNLFDDFITISYKKNGQWVLHQFKATTDPGLKAVREYSNPKGVARLVPNQYRGSHKIGLHKQKYQALVQAKPVTVWRDANKDNKFDTATTDTGLFGINIHKSNPIAESQLVENWSEGCQVFKSATDFALFMSICNQASILWGPTFTYTLLESNDIASAITVNDPQTV